LENDLRRAAKTNLEISEWGFVTAFDEAFVPSEMEIAARE